MNFDRYIREGKQNIEEYGPTVCKTLPLYQPKRDRFTSCVIGFKLLDTSRLSQRDHQLVINGVHTTKNMYEQTKPFLKGFHGDIDVVYGLTELSTPAKEPQVFVHLLANKGTN